MSASAQNATPEPARPSIWNEDRWKTLFVLVTIVGSIVAAIAFIENRVNTAIDDEIEKVNLQLEAIKGDVDYMRGRMDQNAEDMGAIKADIATAKMDLKEIKAAVSQSKPLVNRTR